MSLFTRMFADVRTVQLTPWGAVSKPDASLGDVYAEVVLLPDGRLRYTANGIYGVSEEFRNAEWISPATAGIGAQYEARFTNQAWIDGPYGNARLEGVPADVWLPITSDIWRRLAGNYSSRWSKVGFDMQVRAAGSTVILASAYTVLSQDARVTSPGGGGSNL